MAPRGWRRRCDPARYGGSAGAAGGADLADRGWVADLGREQGRTSAPLQDAAREVVVARAEAESLRLLYVAATRARCWLIVAAAGKASEESWYGMLRAAAEQLPVLPLDGGRQRHEYGVWEAPLVEARGGLRWWRCPTGRGAGRGRRLPRFG